MGLMFRALLSAWYCRPIFQTDATNLPAAGVRLAAIASSTARIPILQFLRIGSTHETIRLWDWLARPVNLTDT